MKRGLTALLATTAFIAGNFAATACRASMSVPAPREPKPAHSCCGKRLPSEPKAPAPTACCCVDGINLAIVDDPAPVAQPAAGIAPAGFPSLPALPPPASVTGGRAPPGRPLAVLRASLLI